MTAEPTGARGDPANTTAEAITLVNAATDPEDLFSGDNPERAYRRLARLLHPDLASRPDAAAAFVKLARLWAARHGSAGRPRVITTRRGTHRITGIHRRGATAVLYRTDEDTLVKLVRNPADNDLVRREAEALRVIEREGDPLLLPYVPRLVESFRYRSGGVERQANVISRVPDGFLTLAEIARRRSPLDPRDAAWIWRRLLVAIGAAHRAGVVHGAVFGHHVLVHPIEHGLVLIDWSQSVPLGTPLTALVTRHRDDYPPGVLAREPATETLDIRLATHCVATLMGHRTGRPAAPGGHGPADGTGSTPPGAPSGTPSGVPARMRAFIRGSLLSPPRDAWGLLAELDELLDDLYGPRRYRPLHL
ncbi:hypothetical protein GCM10010156_63280 [Planobispora rosea]|uniref:Protein kinase domain-containing protein n=1 Tax=Planobispora rosea TaxID=35762 RepID=A0A8J3S7V9_PLARO|nr:lipopolysaccharide kinase InaA family protein [Planobispora rosea]GGS96440.1 hypothetical protein GCM10010156_63280 [Planobispora rosea]GIH87627.1 hypothetical protein Pro02_60350 [Planobispora rosea]